MRTLAFVSRTHRSLVLAGLAGLTTWLGVEAAAAAAPCNVTLAADDVNLPGTLRHCIDRVNQGLTDHVVIQAFQWYAPNSPLVIERSAVISGYGRIVMPGDEFVGDSLFVVGSQCPGAGCQGQAVVEIEGLEIAAVGVAGVRGIDVRAGHQLRLEDAQLLDFTKPTSSGGCLRAGQQSSLTLVGTAFEGCAAADGGAVFSEGASTVVSDSTFTGNTASWNGGAIHIGQSGFFARTLQVEASSLTGNSGHWGGAIAAAGASTTVELLDTELVGNTATVRGGGLYGKGTIEACTFDRNQAGSSGGGLYLVEDAAVLDSTLWANESAVGGGLAFQPAGEYVLTLESSTLALNIVAGDAPHGAGMAVLGGKAFVRNSTLTDNLAKDVIDTSYGGGLAAQDARVIVEHATFADNSASEGGGIWADAQSSIELGSSIVAYSVGGDCEILGGFDTQTSLDTDSTCKVTFAGLDPVLDVLGDNGGLTHTRLPGTSDVQDVAACLSAEDQRHEPRSTKVCDLGAVEL